MIVIDGGGAKFYLNNVKSKIDDYDNDDDGGNDYDYACLQGQCRCQICVFHNANKKFFFAKNNFWKASHLKHKYQMPCVINMYVSN